MTKPSDKAWKLARKAVPRTQPVTLLAIAELIQDLLDDRDRYTSAAVRTSELDLLLTQIARAVGGEVKPGDGDGLLERVKALAQAELELEGMRSRVSSAPAVYSSAVETKTRPPLPECPCPWCTTEGAHDPHCLVHHADHEADELAPCDCGLREGTYRQPANAIVDVHCDPPDWSNPTYDFKQVDWKEPSE